MTRAYTDAVEHVRDEALDRVMELEALLHRAWPMLNRLSHYELAEEIRTALFKEGRTG